VRIAIKKNPSLITISEFLEWCERLLPDATLEDIDPELTKLIQQNFQHYSQFFYVLAWARRYCNGNEVIDFELINFTFEELTSGLTITELTLLTQAICYDYYLVQEEIEEAREDNDALALSRDANYLLDIKNFTFEWVRKAKKELGIIGGSDRPSV